MYIAILGRQPTIGIAELERLYGASHVRWFSDSAAIIEDERFDVNQLGGTQKAGRIILRTRGDWRSASTKIIHHYATEWAGFSGKLTLGISAYGFPVTSRDVQKTGLILKTKLKNSGVSIRLVPNAESALNTAASHHNKLGLANNKVELLVVRDSSGEIIIAESVGAQNITALAARDQNRPKRDAFVGMLPPKLARIMVNLAGLPHEPSARILDPFCGTGVVLQEAALLSYSVYGTDLSEKMIRYSRDNLQWLFETYHMHTDWYLHEGDAMTTTWQQPVDAVVCESYLGQPFSAPPSPQKLVKVLENCDHIISTFLKNIHPQLADNTPLIIAVPAWRDANGNFTHLPLIERLGTLGFRHDTLRHVRQSELIYYRESQVVARELLLLTKA